jgi:aspartyl-tRNA synthetase
MDQSNRPLTSSTPKRTLKKWVDAFDAKPGDLLLILSGQGDKTRKQLNELRLEMGSRLGLRNPDEYRALWVVLISRCWNSVRQKTAGLPCTIPFTSPKPEDIGSAGQKPGPCEGQCIRYGHQWR